MRDESDGYSYQGHQFASREAMEQFIQDRAPVNVSAVRVSPTKGIGFGGVVAIVAALFVATCIFNVARSPADTGPQPAGGPGAVVLDDDVAQKAATVINAAGQLCARVTSIARVQGDVYTVACVRYRDGTGIATYEMNAATGAVK